MLFHVFNIEQRSETEVLLHGKQPETLDPISSIKICDIISPVYFLATKGQENALLDDIKAFNNDIVKYEFVKRENIFHKGFSRHLDLILVHFSRNISIESFFSEYCELSFKAFQNPIENLLITKKIMGPGIVNLENIKKNVVSYNDVSFVKNAKFPHLKIASFASETSGGNMQKFVYFSKDSGEFHKYSTDKSDAPEYKILPSFKDCYSVLNNMLKTDSPDVVLFYNFHAQSKLQIKDRITCDIFSFAAGTIKGRDYSIQEICNFYKINKRKGLTGDAVAIVEVFEAMSALNLAKEMAEISGYLLNKCLSNCRAERIEFTLLHELYAKDYLFPPNIPKQNIKYSGGLVLDPMTGFYEDLVLLLDFNSLYPSIIQEFNVCFSTVGSANFYLTEDNLDNVLTDPNILTSVADRQEESFLPKILRNLVKRRRSVKELLKNCKNDEERTVLDVRQKAIKLTANSIYGCLGFPNSRFCNFEMAAFITAKGREILNETKLAAEKLDMKVIYGDTDSIMIHTKYPGELQYYDRALECGKSLVEVINKKYNNIEIELEKVFKKMLLYTKKKYAALVFDKTGSYIETKGIDLVRRDFCRASTDLSRTVLNIILEDKEVYKSEDKENKIIESGNYKKINNTPETVEKIYNACSDFYSTLYKRPVDDFAISTVLNKDLSAYNLNSNQPHIHLAQRLKESKGLVFTQDDVITYVIGEGEGSISARSFHPNEVFKIDYQYYIKNQILPPLFRLINLLKYIHCEKIGLIFNIKEYNFRPNTSKISFITNCCENVQEPNANCLKCSLAIPDSFYISKVVSILDENVQKLYKDKGTCLDCNLEYYNHCKSCLMCNKELKFDYKNQDFNLLIDSLEDSFKNHPIPDIVQIIKSYSEVSSYRVINMYKYFAEELEQGKMIKN